MYKQNVESLKNRFEELPSPLPERKNPHRPWDVDPENDIPFIPEDPDDVPDDEDISIGSKMEVIE